MEPEYKIQYYKATQLYYEIEDLILSSDDITARDLYEIEEWNIKGEKGYIDEIGNILRICAKLIRKAYGIR
jgi:hypothetical protein